MRSLARLRRNQMLPDLGLNIDKGLVTLQLGLESCQSVTLVDIALSSYTSLIKQRLDFMPLRFSQLVELLDPFQQLAALH